MSSFQLHWSATVRPAAAALLNIAPDHLDWHGSMERYTAAKLRVWAGGVAVGNVDDPVVAEALQRVDATKRVGVTLDAPARGQLGVQAGVLVDWAFAETAQELLAADEVRPSGSHNVSNALAAAALARAHGVSVDAVRGGLRAFVPDRHRNEHVHNRAGVNWIDDSKATNPHAAFASLQAYPRIVWIAGGQLKDAPVDDLVAAVADRLVAVVLLGVDRQQIAQAVRRHAPDVPVIDVDSTDDGAMTEAVRAAAGLARPGDTVLLAPAAASYDMYSGYAARGNAFAAAVRALDVA
jgi:UDP-N-acetylmuramoylalanine--D-glutamate ligase